MRSVIPVAIVLVLLAPERPPVTVSVDDRTFDDLSAFVNVKMKEYGVPGASVGILFDGKMSTRGFGITNVDHPLPVTEGTLFQVGSISKTFAGTAVMRLVDQGRIRLAASVRSYLPEFSVADPEVSREVTVLDLLTHMGGWEGDVFEDTGDGDDALAKYVTLLRTAEQVAPLRTVWSYNNSGFIVAGRIIEVVTGKPYEAALQELVLDRLALENTYIRPADVMTMRFAVGHGGGSNELTVLRPWPIGRFAHPAGGVISTAPDLLKYAQFHLGDGTAGGLPVLSAASLQQMHTSVLVKQGTDDEMAITWHVTTNGVRQIAHGGATLGQQALLTLVPERRFAIALLTNSGTGARFNRDVARWVLKHYLSVDEFDPTPLTVQPDPQPFAASYSRAFADVTATVENGHLMVQSIQKRGFPNASSPIPPPGPKTAFAFYAKDRAIALEGPQQGARIDFIRKPDGSIGWIRVGGRIHRRAGVSS
jgi:CubicO group peptidase (beta-lactamase class C family)